MCSHICTHAHCASDPQINGKCKTVYTHIRIYSARQKKVSVSNGSYSVI